MSAWWPDGKPPPYPQPPPPPPPEPPKPDARRRAARLVTTTAAAGALALLPALLPLAGLVVGALALARHRADDGERPHGHHAGYRWRTSTGGEWHPPRPADDEPDQHTPRHQGPRDNLTPREQQ
jgi:hypothetical protein